MIPLKGLSPLNARFIAALYLGGGVVILIVAFVRRAIDARIALYAFFVITALVLLMTFGYWEEFTTDGVPWLWLFTYIVDPILAPLAIVTLGLVGPAEPGGHRLTGALHRRGGGLRRRGDRPPPRARADGGRVALGADPAARPRLRRVLPGVRGRAPRSPPTSGAWRPSGRSSSARWPCSPAPSLASLMHLDAFDHGPGRWLWFASHVLGDRPLRVRDRVARARVAERPPTLRPAGP